MAGIERYVIVDPDTSQEVKRRLREAIDHGSKELEFTIAPDDTTTGPRRIRVRFRLNTSRYSHPLVNEYLGESIEPTGTMTIRVYTHPDLAAERATVTLVRHE